ncbi:MAG: phosphatase PAP2 family protein [Flavobacteriales bacterium]|nr:phosphatase PAP2 family protein [Flavobacteriales bacterium]
MLDKLDHIDRTLFLFLNGTGPQWMDQWMWYTSKMLFWSPVYLILLWALYQKLQRRHFWIALGGLAVLLFITDFVVVHSIKNVVMRPRPGYNPALDGLIHFVKDGNGNFYKGGRFGFFSNHASNYAGVITYFILLMRPMQKWIYVLLVLWLLMIVYSRIYLGVHYPGDILAGIIFGTSVAYLIYRIYLKLTLFKPQAV